MKNALKRSLSVFLAVTIIFGSAYVGLGEIDFKALDFSRLFAVKAKAASESDLMFSLNDDGQSYSVVFCNHSASGEIFIPSTYNGLPVISVEESTFASCSDITAINVDINNAYYSSENGVLYNKDKTKLIAYPAGKPDTSFRVPDGVRQIGCYAFSGCTNLTSIAIPDSVTSISYAKSYLSLSQTIVDIRYEYAFNNCSSLTEINVDTNNTVYSSENGVLYNKDKTRIVKYPAGKIDTSFSIPMGVTSISDCAFEDSSNLNSIIIPDSVAYIGDCVFQYCNNLTTVEIPDGVSSIGDAVFDSCSSLISVIIPVSVTSIGSFAFYDCGNLTDVYYKGTEAEWNAISKGDANAPLSNATIHFNEPPMLVFENNIWCYKQYGNTLTHYTGLVEYGGNYYHIANGILDWNYSGLSYYNGEWYYVTNGMIDWSYTGLTNYNGTWYYVVNGYLNWYVTTLALYNGNWYYVENGAINWNYSGLAYYNGEWYYITNGMVDWNYTDLVEYYGNYYYVHNGYLNWNYSGLAYYNGEWYYVTNGVIDWNYTGLTCYNSTWYYIVNGYLNWSVTTLVYYIDTWYYVENGTINWNSNTLVNYYGDWYYTVGGVVAWDYTGYVNYYGTNYYITNGFLDWSRQ